MDELWEFLSGRTVGVSLDGQWMWHGTGFYQWSKPMTEDEVKHFEALIRKNALLREFKENDSEDENEWRQRVFL